MQPKQRNRVLIATGGITGQGDFSVLHRPHVGFRPGDVEQVRRSGAGGRRCTAGGCTAGGATGRLRWGSVWWVKIEALSLKKTKVYSICWMLLNVVECCWIWLNMVEYGWILLNANHRIIGILKTLTQISDVVTWRFWDVGSNEAMGQNHDHMQWSDMLLRFKRPFLNSKNYFHP